MIVVIVAEKNKFNVKKARAEIYSPIVVNKAVWNIKKPFFILNP